MSTSSRKEPLSRKDKIKLLNDLIQGRTTLREQFPGVERIFIKRDEVNFFKEVQTGKQYVVDDVKELEKEFPFDRINVIYLTRIIITKSKQLTY